MAQRTGEFAIRFALGACTRDITRIVLGSGAKLAALGLAFGVLGAVGLSRLLAGINPGMRFDSVSTLAGPAMFLVAVALFASWLPARRAARINPIEALRAE
jgi:ABC-type antimicrobial peptide transport system permease subunit